MGVSTNAEIAFGIDLGDENPLVPRDADGDPLDYDADDPDGLDDYLARRAGIENPYETKLPHEINNGGTGAYEEWKAQNPWFESEADAYFDAKLKLEEAAPVEILYHCSYDYPMYILALKGTNQSAWRGDPKKLNLERLSLMVTEDKLVAARKFCAENGLPEFYGADWLLFSMWG